MSRQQAECILYSSNEWRRSVILKVLIVDDETIICQGLACTVKAMGYEVIGSASNGMEALKRIEKERPDIVFADIRMPVCNGIELVKTCCEKKCGTKFILLTGYGEFDYAQKAMRYGVKHYILKPAKDKDIAKALHDVSAEIMQSRRQSTMIRNLHERLQRITPQAMEQFLSEFIQNGRCAEADLEFFQNLFSSVPVRCRLILMKLEGKDDYVTRLALKYISMELLNPGRAYANTTVEDIIVLVTEIQDQNLLFEKINEIKENFRKCFQETFSASISLAGEFQDIPKLFQEAKEGFYYRFYLAPDTIMYPELVQILKRSDTDRIDFQYGLSETKMMTGDQAIIYEEINSFFQSVENSKLPITAAKNNILQFYLILNRALWGYDHEIDIEKINRIFQMETLADIKTYFVESTKSVLKQHLDFSNTVQAKLVQQMKSITSANLSNPKLNLKWIAKNKLFMNEDYLSKIFRQTTSERFSHYLTRTRVNSAIKMIESSPEIKICTLSNTCGFGDNTAYFCTVFKNMVGITPTEYKKKIAGGTV